MVALDFGISSFFRFCETVSIMMRIRPIRGENSKKIAFLTLNSETLQTLC